MHRLHSITAYFLHCDDGCVTGAPLACSSSSLRKNLEVEPSLSCWRVGSGCASLSDSGFGAVNSHCLRRQQFGNADQVVGDQIEHEVGRDAG